MINSQKPVLSTPKDRPESTAQCNPKLPLTLDIDYAVVPIIIVVVMFAKKKNPQKPMDICHQDI